MLPLIPGYLHITQIFRTATRQLATVYRFASTLSPPEISFL
jgi:hypothetical protein